MTTNDYELVMTIVREVRGWLPYENERGEFHSSNSRLSPDTRTKLAFLEDSESKAYRAAVSKHGNSGKKLPAMLAAREAKGGE